jgi:hypothetical protein
MAAGRGRRLWLLLALVMTALVLAQACGKSGRSTGPTQSTSLQLKLRRVGAQIPSGCNATFTAVSTNPPTSHSGSVQNGTITFQGLVGVTYVITVFLDCGPQGSYQGSAEITIQPGLNTAEIVIVASQAGISCDKSQAQPNEGVGCHCTAQSASPDPSVSWTGSVSPKSGADVTFSNGSPGTYTVTCTVNNVASASTNITVTEPPPAPPQTGTVVVFNDANGELIGLRRRGLASHLSEFYLSSIFVRLVGIPNTTRSVDAGHDTTYTGVPAGPRQVEGSCNSSFDRSVIKNATVVAGGSVEVHFDLFEDFGNCD